MGAGVWFWLFMILSIVFGFFWNRDDIRGGNWGVAGNSLLLWILLALLGWKVFGSPLQ